MTNRIEPLRKTTMDGVVYHRPPEIERFIERTLDRPFDELIDRALIKDRRHADYVPSEVLMYHLRTTRRDNSDARFEILYSIVKGRIEHACPRPNRHVGDTELEIARIAELRDLIVERVVDLILEDRQAYCDKLDIYEIRFDRAVRMLRIDKFGVVARRENPKTPLEYDQESGDIAAEVEEALAALKATALSKEEELTYRIQVRRAIDALPDDERRVIDMMLADLPIEADDPKEPSISALLGCVEKTVRNRRNRAYAKIKTALRLEEVGHDK